MVDATACIMILILGAVMCLLLEFVEISHYYRPAGLPREKQPWLARVWRR